MLLSDVFKRHVLRIAIERCPKAERGRPRRLDDSEALHGRSTLERSFLHDAARRSLHTAHIRGRTDNTSSMCGALVSRNHKVLRELATEPDADARSVATIARLPGATRDV